MDKRRIGQLEVSVVGLGCNNFGTRLDEPASAAVIHAALDAGINFLDTADIYGLGLSEEYVGRALGDRREAMVLATKFGKPMGAGKHGARPDYIRRAVDDSLRRLRTDRIDLYQLHEPDDDVPIADTLGALDDLVRAGKVREIGCSNFSAAQIREASAAATDKGIAPFTSVQNEYSLLEREPERGVLAECERLGAAFLPFYPLASGLLTGKYRRGEPAPQGTRLSKPGRLAEPATDAKLARVEKLRAFANERGYGLLEIAFAWLLARPVVASVIAGATSPAQVNANVATVALRLTTADMRALDEI